MRNQICKTCFPISLNSNVYFLFCYCSYISSFGKICKIYFSLFGRVIINLEIIQPLTTNSFQLELIKGIFLHFPNYSLEFPKDRGPFSLPILKLSGEILTYILMILALTFHVLILRRSISNSLQKGKERRYWYSNSNLMGAKLTPYHNVVEIGISKMYSKLGSYYCNLLNHCAVKSNEDSMYLKQFILLLLIYFNQITICLKSSYEKAIFLIMKRCGRERMKSSWNLKRSMFQILKLYQ